MKTLRLKKEKEKEKKKRMGETKKQLKRKWNSVKDIWIFLWVIKSGTEIPTWKHSRKTENQQGWTESPYLTLGTGCWRPLSVPALQ